MVLEEVDLEKKVNIFKIVQKLSGEILVRIKGKLCQGGCIENKSFVYVLLLVGVGGFLMMYVFWNEGGGGYCLCILEGKHLYFYSI